MEKTCENCICKITCASYLAIKAIKEEIPKKYPWIKSDYINPELLSWFCSVYTPMIKDKIETEVELQ